MLSFPSPFKMEGLFPSMFALFPQQQNFPALLLEPHTDILDTGKELIVTMPKPNIPLEKIKTEVKGNILTIQGCQQAQQQKQEKNSYQSQFNHASFFQQIQLPVTVDKQKIRFHVDEKRNLLLLICPKAQVSEKTPKEKMKD